MPKEPTSGAFKPGHKKAGGRKPGSLNKTTASVKEAIESAFQKAGGDEYLLQQAKENPAAFLTLLGKILPRDMNVALESNLLGLLSGLTKK